MPFLTISSTAYEAQTQGAAQSASTYIGVGSRAFSGAWRDGRRALKRAWTFTMIPWDEPTYLSFVSLIGIGTVLTASGDFTNSVAVSVVIDITAAPYIPQGSGFMRVATITLTEV